MISAAFHDVARPFCGYFGIWFADVTGELAAAPVTHATLSGEHHRLPVGPAAVCALDIALDVRNRVRAEEIGALVYRHRTCRPSDPGGESALRVNTARNIAVGLRHAPRNPHLIAVAEVLGGRRYAPHSKRTPERICFLRPFRCHPCDA